MNSTNKAIVGVVFGVTLLFAVVSFGLSIVKSMDNGVATICILNPFGDLCTDLSTVAGVSAITNVYVDFLKLFGGSAIQVLLMCVGYVIAVMGLLTPWTNNIHGDENPAEYIWTHRRGALLHTFTGPWGLIPTVAHKDIRFVIVPVILLPFSMIWSLMLLALMIIPYFVVYGATSAMISSAAKQDRRALKSVDYAVCPKCKRKFDTPKIRCRCNLVLDYPVPNEFGYKFHTCNNGHKIPCTHGRRGKLRTICPYCWSDISTKDAMPVVFSIVGSLGSGKTTLMLAAIDSIMQIGRVHNVIVDPATPGVSRDAIKAKDLAPRTPHGELDSECVFLRSGSMDDRELIFNDLSGSEYEARKNKTLFEEYYRYTDGIVFAFDPNALAKKRAFPMDPFESFHSAFCEINGIGPSTVSDVPFAVVATKNDILATPLKSSEVREFLCSQGQEGFVMVVESLFSNVRYFAANSLGEDCWSSATPFWWIVSQRDKVLASKLPMLSI